MFEKQPRMNSNSTDSLINLDDVIEQFHSWQKFVSEMSKKNISLQDEVLNLKKLLSTNKELQAQLQHDYQIQGSLVETLQTTLGRRCDLEDENRSLKTEILKLEKDMIAEKKAIEQKTLELEKTLQDQQAYYISQVTDTEQSLKKQAISDKAKLGKTIEDKGREIKVLQKQKSDQEKDHQAQLIQIRLECSKLLKLQKQTNKAQQSASSTANQDIYRKKLQHAKTESEKEITNLKRNVADLKHRISVFEQKANGNYSSSSGSSLQVKKRKF